MALLTNVVFGQEQGITPKSISQKDFQDYLANHPPTVTYDKFKKITTIDYVIPLNGIKGGNGLTCDWVFEISAFVQTNKTNFCVFLTSVTKDWKYLQCNDFHWLIDGKKFGYYSEKYSNRMNGEGNPVSEVFQINLTQKQFKNLVRCKKIEFEVCNDQFALFDDVTNALVTFNEKYNAFLKTK